MNARTGSPQVTGAQVRSPRVHGTCVLLHICCGPCAAHVVRALGERYSVTGCFYNPNIFPEEEHRRRLAAAEKVASANSIELIHAPYEQGDWLRAVEGLEDEPEGGRRCARCFHVRLSYVARLAAERGFDRFATTLTVSPHKDAAAVNEAGRAAAAEAGVAFHEADFKKGGGFEESCRLCREMGLHRQDYCGCSFST